MCLYIKVNKQLTSVRATNNSFQPKFSLVLIEVIVESQPQGTNIYLK